jgi:nicotinamidase-related amidase
LIVEDCRGEVGNDGSKMTAYAGGRTALLLMDFMPLVVPFCGGDEALLRRIGEAAQAARAADVDVVHVRVHFPHGAAEVAPTNRVFAAAAGALSSADGTAIHPLIAVAAVHPLIAVAADDFVVTKKRASAFAGSDLDLLLRARRIGTVVMAGVATSGVVLSTVRQAADLDYQIVVLADGCADRDQDVHAMLMDKVFPTQADVTTIGAWTSGS